MANKTESQAVPDDYDVYKIRTDEETGDVFLELEQLVGPDIASKAKFYTLEHDDNNVLILTLFDKDEKKITLTK